MGAEFCLGVDVGGTRLRLAAQDVSTGRRSDPIEVAVPRSVEAMVEAIDSLARSLIGSGTIRSVGVGLPGQVLDDRCVWVPNLRFLDGVPLAELVAERFSAPCRLINDAQATLLAEVAEGAARERSDVVLVAVGTGIGGAVRSGGRLLRGAHGCAGAFGWLPFAAGTADADHGRWEQVGSGQALEKRAAPWGGVGGLLTAARQRDAAARGAVVEYGAVLGEGIAALASIYDPEVVVFAGGLVSAFDLLREPIADAMVVYGSPAGRRTPLVAAALGSTAGVIGALGWASAGGGGEAR